MANEDFYEAAIRHWIGGRIFGREEKDDKTVCMQGFAAECALKKIMEKIEFFEFAKKYSHSGDELFRDVKMLLLGDMVSAVMIHPGLGLKLSSIALPKIVFDDHPARRYFEDDIFSMADARDCQNAAELLIREMVSMRLDGYL